MKRTAAVLTFGVVMIVLLIVAYQRGIFINPGKPARFQITTSFYPLYFFTTEIVGDKGTVFNITPAGAEPHDYEPTTSDLARIEDSALLILNGGQLEAWGEKVRSILQGSGTEVVAVGDSLATGGSANQRDPHVWLDPPLAKQEAEAIAAAVIKIDPANSDYYHTNEIRLENKLDALDKNFRDTLATCEKKDLVTSHAAFGYLSRDYGLNQISIAGLSPDAEPSPETLASVADFARKNKVQYIFFESLVSPRLADTIASEVGAKTLVLNPLEGLSEADIKDGKNYFTEMQSNLNNLTIALTCQLK